MDRSVDGAALEREHDQRVVLHGVPWSQYVALRRLDDRPGLRMTYLEGTLEIMSPSSNHEDIKKRIARMLEVWALERDIELTGFGSTTYRSRARQRGREPDECYCVDRVNRRRPDIALEVDVSSGSIDKLEVYRGLGVPEVWIWTRGSITVHRLARKGYTATKRSALLPELDRTLLASFAAAATTQTKAVLAWRAAVRAAS